MLTTWQPAQRDSRLTPDEVHLWWCRGAAHAAAGAGATTEELARAKAMAHPRRRAQFLAGRGLLRCVLASYLGCPPGEVPIIVAASGKPCLDPRRGLASRIRFSLTHSADHVLLAVTLDHNVGVDVEHCRRRSNLHALAERFFSAAEFTTFQQVRAEQQESAFLRTWTCKEAVVKALGGGISMGLDRFDVQVHTAEPPAVLAERWNAASDALRWHLLAPDVGSDAVAAAAVHAPADTAITWRLWRS